MSLKLIDPINSMPLFQANQVLTYNHLNDLAAYLYQQERYTRNKLIGSGIVCGLSFKWKTVAPNAEVVIDEGCAITSAGYLIVFTQPVDINGAILPYTCKRNFTTLKDVAPFKNVAGIANKKVYELLTLDEYNAETEIPKSFLSVNDINNNVLILLFDIEALNIAKCLDESCDDKGKLYQYTPRPLLVPKDVIDNANVLGLTEEGRGWKETEKTFSTTYLGVPNLFLDPAIKINNISSNADLQKLFLNACQVNNYVNTVKNKLNNIIAAYPWVLQKQLECMKAEVAGLSTNPVNLGDIFQQQVNTFKASALANTYSEYLYDYIRDVADCYNDLYSLVADLIGECGGDENRYPFHVLLGLPQTNDTLSCYEELKFTEQNYKYRSYFIPSPIADTQFNLYERVQHTLKRLVRVVAYFKVDVELTTIKVIPDKDYDTSLAIRAIPYYYDSAKFLDIFRVWNYDSTRHNKLSNPRGYHGSPPQTQTDLLRNDTRKINFYRIEGHIGKTVTAAQNDINDIRDTYNLPFNVTSVFIQSKTNTLQCAFADLEAEYNYYKDRVLGYLREIERWIDGFIILIQDLIKKDPKNDTPELKEFYDALKKLREIIFSMQKILEAPCIESFKYDDFKKMYASIYETALDVYMYIIGDDTSNLSEAFNSLSNILNIIFFRPIYKIWYMYQYRVASLKLTEASSLQLLAGNAPGLEHLAGVRRGETFLLVSDADNKDIVVADFNMPFAANSCCDCKEEPCDGKNRSLVSPLQKPVIMVVDYSYIEENALFKTKAFLDANKEFYVLELDSMGFYKADSDIAEEIKIFIEVEDDEKEFDNLIGTWENEKMVLRYKINSQYQGIFKLNYILKGDFDEGYAQGIIYLIVMGRKTDVGGNYNVALGDQGSYYYYPYDKRTIAKDKVAMQFDGATAQRVIGNDKVNVYTSPNGNEYLIDKDTDGYPYIQALNIKTPGIENIPFTLTETGNISKGITKMNVINKDDKLQTDTVAGVIKTPDGQPLKDARLTTTSGKKVITNEKGEYSFAGLKTGDIITVEKQGFKAADIQVNSQAGGDLQMEKAPLINISGLQKIDLSGKLNELAANLNISTLKNFMK